MTEKDAWDLYFCNVASIRFHPANDQTREDVKIEILRAAHLADMMIFERRQRIDMPDRRSRICPPGSQRDMPSSESLKE